MPTYQNSPSGFAVLRTRIIKRSVPLVLFSLTGGLAIFYFVNDKPFGLLEWIILIVFLAAIMTFAILKSIARQQEIYNSYRLVIDNKYLSRQQAGVPVMNLAFDKITQITKAENGDLLITGQKKENFIFISAFIEKYEEIVSQLSAIMPIAQRVKKNLLAQYPEIGAVGAIGLMCAVYISNNKIIAGVSGIALTVILIWCFYKIQASKLIDSKVKRTSWFILIVILSVLFITWHKVFIVVR